MIFVELYAGLAAVTLHLTGQKPPVSRIGAKTGYAAAIAAELGLPPLRPEDKVVLVEVNPAVANVLRALFSPEGRARAAAHIESRLHLPAREVWDQAHRDLTNGQLCAPGDWLLYTAGARGGIGGFKGAHVHRPSVDGFIPARAALARRLRAFEDPPCRVEVVTGFAEGLAPIPGAVAYLDPPYQGRQGFAGAGGNPLAARLIEMAVRWAAAGCRVGISEAVPLDVPGARHVDLTGRREGQTRRSMTRDAQEWLTVVG